MKPQTKTSQSKRIDNIIEAFRLLPKKKLIIAGEGPERRELEKNAPSNISFVGFLPDQKHTLVDLSVPRAMQCS